MAEKKTIDAEAVEGADTDGDGHITKAEMDMHLEFKRKELEDQDAQRDAMRKMTWFALFGMLLYPFAIIITTVLGQDDAAKIIGDIAPTYFVAIAACLFTLYSICAKERSYQG